MRKILKNGKIILDESSACQALLKGKSANSLHVEFNHDPPLFLVNLHPNLINHDDFTDEEIEIRKNDYFMPEEYKHINLRDFFLQKTRTDKERERVLKEVELIERTRTENLFRYLIYLSDVIRNHDIVVGTGRGSSTSLYILYLVGLHRVNSLKYDLNPNEFFNLTENGETDDNTKGHSE